VTSSFAIRNRNLSLDAVHVFPGEEEDKLTTRPVSAAGSNFASERHGVQENRLKRFDYPQVFHIGQATLAILLLWMEVFRPMERDLDNMKWCELAKWSLI
jgi:hypothetical protein